MNNYISISKGLLTGDWTETVCYSIGARDHATHKYISEPEDPVQEVINLARYHLGHVVPRRLVQKNQYGDVVLSYIYWSE